MDFDKNCLLASILPCLILIPGCEQSAAPPAPPTVQPEQESASASSSNLVAPRPRIGVSVEKTGVDRNGQMVTQSVDFYPSVNTPKAIKPAFLTIFDVCRFRASTPDDLKPFLALNIPVNQKDESGCSPLWYAAKHCANPQVIETLLSAGAHVDLTGGDAETTPIIEAARSSNSSIVSLLLSAGSVHSPTDRMFGTALNVAAESNTDPGVALTLIRAGCSLDSLSQFGTPLIGACRHNPNPEVVKVLIQAGSDVDYCFTGSPDSELTPLKAAILNDAAGREIIRILVEGNAILNPPRSEVVGLPLLQFAEMHQKPEKFLLLGLLDTRPMSWDFEDIIRSGYLNPEEIRYLLRKGRDPNETCSAGEPLVYFLISTRAPCFRKWFSRKREILDILLLNGASVQGPFAGREPIVIHTARYEPELVLDVVRAGARLQREWWDAPFDSPAKSAIQTALKSFDSNGFPPSRYRYSGVPTGSDMSRHPLVRWSNTSVAGFDQNVIFYSRTCSDSRDLIAGGVTSKTILIEVPGPNDSRTHDGRVLRSSSAWDSRNLNGVRNGRLFLGTWWDIPTPLVWELQGGKLRFSGELAINRYAAIRNDGLPLWTQSDLAELSDRDLQELFEDYKAVIESFGSEESDLRKKSWGAWRAVRKEIAWREKGSR